jgi:hypothetical protein
VPFINTKWPSFSLLILVWSLFCQIYLLLPAFRVYLFGKYFSVLSLYTNICLWQWDAFPIDDRFSVSFLISICQPVFNWRLEIITSQCHYWILCNIKCHFCCFPNSHLFIYSSSDIYYLLYFPGCIYLLVLYVGYR